MAKRTRAAAAKPRASASHRAAIQKELQPLLAMVGAPPTNLKPATKAYYLDGAGDRVYEQ